MNKRERILLIVVIAVLAAASFYATFTLYTAPAMDERDRLQSNVEVEEERVEMLGYELLEKEREQEMGVEHTGSAQRKVPVQEMTDQVLLGLNQAQEVSGVVIQDIFINHNAIVDPIRLDEEDNEVSEETEEDGEEPVDVDSPLDGLERQVFTMEIRVNQYENLARFIHELEALDRVMNVEFIYFTGADDVRIFDGASDIFFELQASAYFYPGLDTLRDETPMPHYMPSEDREQPFYE
ncbi:hypothetical protein [Salisediminibacterium beveridgei]|uniref:Type IV pilus biogenesis protein PilO n=1 Tax=Salisediminibacterium beveridgei TaxID=632773 RepID=A0A1D7QTR4_9BACI|nr:hypothetical protein [Salisediminibacterium beveridgei]AOM82358.1 Type IV pilus biogenesis protein PilO [Salisediminibacterium beveridgei]